VAAGSFDSLKFAGGSFTLMPEEAVRSIIELCHNNGVLVSTGGFIERVLVQGSDAVRKYIVECKRIGFDIVEISAGCAGCFHCRGRKERAQPGRSGSLNFRRGFCFPPEFVIRSYFWSRSVLFTNLSGLAPSRPGLVTAARLHRWFERNPHNTGRLRERIRACSGRSSHRLLV
jgi:(2R)-phospho-3-sulfolactate synthase (ComA)